MFIDITTFYKNKAITFQKPLSHQWQHTHKFCTDVPVLTQQEIVWNIAVAVMRAGATVAVCNTADGIQEQGVH